MEKKIISGTLLKKVIRNKLIESFQNNLLKEGIEDVKYNVFSNAIQSIDKINEYVLSNKNGKNDDKNYKQVLIDLFFDIKTCLTALFFLEFILPEASKTTSADILNYDEKQDPTGYRKFDKKIIQTALEANGKGNLNTLNKNFGFSDDNNKKIIDTIISKKYYNQIWNLKDKPPQEYLQGLKNICKEVLQLINSSNLKFLLNYQAWNHITAKIDGKIREEGKWFSYEDSFFTMKKIKFFNETFWMPLTIDKSAEAVTYIINNLPELEQSLTAANLNTKELINQELAKSNSPVNNTSSNTGNTSINNANPPAAATINNLDQKISDNTDFQNQITSNLNDLLIDCNNIDKTKKIGLIFNVLYSLGEDDAAFNALKDKILSLISNSNKSDEIKKELTNLVTNNMRKELKQLAEISNNFFKEYDKLKNISQFNQLVKQQKQKILEFINNLSIFSITGLLLKNKAFIQEINNKLNTAVALVQPTSVSAGYGLFSTTVQVEYYNEEGARDIVIPVNPVNQYGAVYNENNIREKSSVNTYAGVVGIGDSLKKQIVNNIKNLSLNQGLINDLNLNVQQSTVNNNTNTQPTNKNVSQQNNSPTNADTNSDNSTVADTKPDDVKMSDNQWELLLKLIRDIIDGKKPLPPKLGELLKKKNISKEEIQAGLAAEQQENVPQADTNSLKDIFRVPQLNGGFFELAKILMSADLLVNYKSGNFKKKKYETAKAYGFIAKKDQEINSVETFFNTPDKIFNSFGLKLSPTALNKLTKLLNDSKKIGQLLNEYFDKKMLKVNEYLLIDGEVFMYIALRLLENLGLESDNFNELHEEYVVQKDPIVLKASAQLNSDIFKQTIDLNKRITISQMLNNRNIKNK